MSQEMIDLGFVVRERYYEHHKYMIRIVWTDLPERKLRTYFAMANTARNSWVQLTSPESKFKRTMRFYRATDAAEAALKRTEERGRKGWLSGLFRRG